MSQDDAWRMPSVAQRARHGPYAASLQSRQKLARRKRQRPAMAEKQQPSSQQHQSRPELQFDPRFLDHYVHYVTVEQHLQRVQPSRNADDASSPRSLANSVSFSTSVFSDSAAETPTENASPQPEDSLWSDAQTITTVNEPLRPVDAPRPPKPTAPQQSRELQVQKVCRRCAQKSPMICTPRLEALTTSSRRVLSEHNEQLQPLSTGHRPGRAAAGVPARPRNARNEDALVCWHAARGVQSSARLLLPGVQAGAGLRGVLRAWLASWGCHVATVCASAV